MKIRLLAIGNSKMQQIGLRLVAIVFAITFLQALPTGQLPTYMDLYKALLAGAIAAILMLESSGNSSGGNTNIETKP